MSGTTIADDILNCAKFLLSQIKPSDWNEQNRVLSKEVSRMSGPLSYDNSPYTREIVDCWAPDHPARIIAVMKAAQIGFSTTVIEAAIGWIISQNPGPILYTVGHELLLKDTMKKIDSMIDNSGIRKLIFNQDKRSRKTKSGDTDLMKEFLNGYLKLGMVNHKTLRNISMMYGFIDDFEGVKGSAKQSGSTRKMIEQRFAAYSDVMKLGYISSPELMATSNIYPVYMLGDQRKYHIPCPVCEEFIRLEWSVKSEKHDSVMCGMKWDKDPDTGLLIPETVRYRCQKCEEHFDDSNKMELMRLGKWKPTAKPSEPGYYSYHISALYASGFMYGWTRYVRDYMQANPEKEAPDEELRKTFYNLCLGLPYEPPALSINSKVLGPNMRKYKMGVIPEKQSIADGNGRIVWLTCAGDMGGLIAGVNSQYDDARLDAEIVAVSESGATYSICHESFGTFQRAYKGGKDQPRSRWSYDISKAMNVWKPFNEFITQKFVFDTGRTIPMGVAMIGIDTGFGEHHAFNFIDRSNLNIVGLKGDKDHKYTTYGDNSANYRESPNRNRLYLLKVSKLKDQLAGRINLKWDQRSGEKQPPGYLNFPQRADGKYEYENYFSHLEAEERKEDKSGNFIWQKKPGNVENHFWDVNNYNMVLSEILMDHMIKEWEKLEPGKWKNATWPEFAAKILTLRKEII